MDPFLWRTISYVIVFFGTGLVLLGSVGTWYFGNLVERVMPFRQSIQSVSATVEIIVDSDESVNSHFMDRGGYLAFCRGQEALLTVAAPDSWGRQLGNSRVQYKGIFNMDANDPAAGKPITYIKEAEYVQIFFYTIPIDANIKGGKAVCTLNSKIRIEISVPEQEIKNGLIFVRNLSGVFADFYD